MKSQAEKIAGLQLMPIWIVKRKHNYWLSEKHKMFTEKSEREKMELVETHVTELPTLRGDLDLETRSYIEDRLNVSRQLRELHETVASSFDEV
jgi:hypothetical protein